MNFDRILKLAAALAAVAAAAAVCVVAASFAVYALAEPWVGRAWAGAIVAGVFALVAVIVALAATHKAKPKGKLAASPPPASPVDKVIGMAKAHPIVAVGAAAVAVTVAVRNPAVVMALVSSFLAGNNAPRPPK